MGLAKKSFVEVQFNWIFIMIVGAIILMFFITLVVQQSKNSNSQISASISFDMGSIFSSAQISTNTENLIDVPPVNIYMVCDGQSGYSSYRIGSTELSMGDGLIVFSPDYLLGSDRKIMTHSLAWNAPFRVTNFLYLSTPSVKYAIINGTYGANSLYVEDRLTDYVFKKIYNNLSSVEYENNYKFKIIYLYDTSISDPTINTFNVPLGLQGLSNKDISMIYVSPTIPDNVEQSGTIYFYQKNGTVFSYVGSSKYIGDASLMGAIFSEDINNYNCNMEKAFKRYKMVAGIYSNRASELVNYYNTHSDPQNCKQKIKDANSSITQILLLPNFNSSILSATESSIADLKGKNKVLQRYSCPVVY